MTRKFIAQSAGSEESMSEQAVGMAASTPRVRWRTPIMACMIAVALQLLLIYAFAPSETLPTGVALLADFGAPRTAQAAVRGDETVRHYGFIVNRPDGAIGTWEISRTIPAPVETVMYESAAETEVADDLEIGDCVEIEVADGAPSHALKIDERDDDVCRSGDGQEHESFNGILKSRPEVKVGTWVISDTAYSVTDSTTVEGPIPVGACVEVEVSTSKPTFAIKIVLADAGDCVDTDDGEDGNESEFRREWEGTIVSFPPLLIGEWVILVGDSKQLTFTTSAVTRLVPTLPAAYAIGRWVEVRVERQLDGSLVANRVRVDDYEFGEIVVRLESAAISETIAAKYNLVLTSTLLNDANIYLFTTEEDDEQFLAAQIAQEEGVIWAEVNYVNGVPEDDGYKTWGWGGKSEPDAYFGQSAYPQIRMGQVTQVYQGDGVVVAVLDTGIYTPHEQFVDRLILPNLDVIDDDSDASEEGPGLAWGHGTHVAGIVAAMAPEAQILPVRVLDENGRGNTFLLAYAIEWVSQQPGVKVINLSLGTQFDSRILHDAIDRAIAKGMLVVAAAGNNGTSQIQYPAGYENVVGVTAVDENSLKASFANYGAGWVDVAAPGVGIMSTMISEEGPGYATWSGTSMSTAFVSGAAALVAEKWAPAGVSQADFDAKMSIRIDEGILAHLTETGLAVDALNPLYVGQIGRLLDVSAALEVDAEVLYMPESLK